MKVPEGFQKAACGVLCSTMMVLAGCSLPTADSLPSFNSPTVSQAQAQARKDLVPKLDNSCLLSSSILTVGVKRNTITAPFVMSSSSSSSELTGFDIDYAYTLADALGLQIKFVEVSDVGRSLGKTCDVVFNAKAGETTTAKVIGNYAESAAALFAKGKTGPIQASDLTGKRVALQKGSLSELALKKTSISMMEVSCTNLNEAFDKLAQGEVDYVLCEAYAGAYLSKYSDGINCVGTLEKPISTGIAVAAKNTTLQAALSNVVSQVQSNGVYDLIRARWLGPTFAISSSSLIKGVTVSSPSTSLSSPSSSSGSSSSSTTLNSSSNSSPNSSPNATNTSAPNGSSSDPGQNAVHL